MKENKIWDGLKHYAGVSFVAAIIFTVLIWAVALTNVFTGTLAHGVFAILATILIIISVGMVGLIKALKQRTSLSNSAWYSLFTGFFAALTLILFEGFFSGLFGITGGFSWVGLTASTTLLMSMALFLDGFVSIYVWELIGAVVQHYATKK